jgi:hypothetical protein
MKIGAVLFPSFPECCQKSIESLWETEANTAKLPTIQDLSPQQQELYRSIQNYHSPIQFESFSNYEDISSFNLSNEEKDRQKRNISEFSNYWCNFGNYCKKFPVNKKDYSLNTCGPLSISGTSAPIYFSENECLSNQNKCSGLEREKCLQKGNCGWCINEKGKGECVKGTPEGPLDIIKYPYCVPQFTQYSTGKLNTKYRNIEANQYIGGYENPYIDDKIKTKSFYEPQLL